MNLERSFCSVEHWTLWEKDQYCLEGFALWCWRRMENISRTDRERNEEVINGMKEERNILQTMKRRKGDCNGHILCRNCLINHVIEGKIDGRLRVRRRGGRRSKQIFDELKGEKLQCKLKEEALDHTVCRTR
jgi:hypothetical protein